MDKAVKVILISCLVIPFIFVILAVLAGIVLVAINPAEQRDKALTTVTQSNMSALSRNLAVAKVEANQDVEAVLSCAEIKGTITNLQPRSTSSCLIPMSSESQNLVYSFNKATKCAIISTANPITTKKKYYYYKDEAHPTSSVTPIESDKLEECK